MPLSPKHGQPVPAQRPPGSTRLARGPGGWTTGLSRRLSTLLGALLVTGLAQAAPAYVMWQEWSAWVPGKPSRAQQFVIQEDGRGQYAEFVDDKLLRLVSFSYPNAEQLPQLMGEFLKLDSRYAIPQTPHRVVEGRGDKTWLFVSAQGQRKHVRADRDLQPRLMRDFHDTLVAPPGGQPGSFVAVQLMPEAFRPDAAELAQMPTLQPAGLPDFPELQASLANPFKLVALPAARWHALLAQLKLSPHAPYARTADGEIIKLMFYLPAQP